MKWEIKTLRRKGQIDVGCRFLFNDISVFVVNLILFTQPLRSGRIWHKVNF